MTEKEAKKFEMTMNFNEIILNIDSLKTKEEFISIQTMMNEIFMNSSFIKENSLKKEIIKKLDEAIFQYKNININEIYISLSFITLLETKIRNIPAYILESLLIDNKKIVDAFKNIFINVYKQNIQINNFQLPSLKNFVNFTFKYPDIINNFFEISFINVSFYYNQYFKMLLQNLDRFMEIVNEEELYRDDFIKKLFIFSDYNNEGNFKKINFIYHKLNNFEKFGKMQKIIRKNNFFLSHIMNANNEYLQKKFFDEILIILKEKTNILEEIEIYEFYQVFFCIFYLLEKYNGFNYLDIFDSLMKISFIVMEKVKDKNKKGIIQLFLRYLKKKMLEYLKSKGGKPDIEDKNEEDILSTEAINLLNFIEEKKNKFENNIYYFY